MTCKVIVCRVGDEPKVEEVQEPFSFCTTSLLDGGYVTERVLRPTGQYSAVLLCDEESEFKGLPFNRNVPDMGRVLPPASFVVDTRKSSPEQYAAPGELGYHAIAGNFLLTDYDGGRGGYASLTDDEIRFFMQYLAPHQCQACKLQKVAYEGARFCGAACTAEWEMGIRR